MPSHHQNHKTTIKLVVSIEYLLNIISSTFVICVFYLFIIHYIMIFIQYISSVSLLVFQRFQQKYSHRARISSLKDEVAFCIEFTTINLFIRLFNQKISLYILFLIFSFKNIMRKKRPSNKRKDIPASSFISYDPRV